MSIQQLTHNQGICRYGNGCTKQHIMPNQQLSSPGEDHPNSHWASSPPPGHSEEFLFSTLPPQSLKSEELIATNKDGERIDTYCPHPSSEAMAAYHARADRRKVCNRYHLAGECGDMSCPYDHSDVSNTIIQVMRYLLRQHPCPRAGRCRSIKCHKGHLCQKPNCKGVKSWHCRFSYRLHTLDLHVAEWVAPIEQADEVQSSTSEDSQDSYGAAIWTSSDSAPIRFTIPARH